MSKSYQARIVNTEEGNYSGKYLEFGVTQIWISLLAPAIKIYALVLNLINFIFLPYKVRNNTYSVFVKIKCNLSTKGLAYAALSMSDKCYCLVQCTSFIVKEIWTHISMFLFIALEIY